MLRFATYLLVVGAASSCLGHLSPAIDRAIAGIALAILTASFVIPALATAPTVIGGSHRSRSDRVAIAITLALALAAAIFAPLGGLWFAAGVLAALSLWLRTRSASDFADCASFAVATLVVAIAAELIRVLPSAWHLQMAVADTFNRVAATIVREPRHLGPTAMALPLLGAGLAWLAARWMLRPHPLKWPLWRAALILIAAHLLYLLALTPLAAWLAKHRPGWQSLLLNSQWLALVLGTLALTMIGAWGRRRDAVAADPASTRVVPASRKRPGAAAGWQRAIREPRVVAGTVLALVFGLVAGRATSPTPAPMRILLYDAGYTNWKVPQHGEYGERSGGMFGLLPFLLQAAGHDVVVSKDLSQLDGPGAPAVVALINIQEFLQPADKERLLAFVRRGGGMLCMGDHTGVAGIRGPFNDLLASTGIRFLFDSATFFAEGWSNGAELRHHPLNRGVRDGENYQVWVGASLELEPTATPVVIGRYGYSDIGDMSNLRMAFLGDRRYNPDEQLGDIVLVAESRLGDGKVLVFGDTSTYQNLALARSWDVVLRSFDHLAARGRAPLAAPAQWLLLLAFVAALGWATSAGRRTLPLVGAAVGLCVASMVTAAGRSPEHALDWSRVRAPSLAAATAGTVPSALAIVDRSHGGRYDLRAWFDPSVGGLMLNLVRDGFFPVVADAFPAAALERAALFVTIAPMRAYDAGERAALRRFMQRGGRVLACVGWEDLDGARSLVAEHGFEVTDVPLSHFRTGDRNEDLVFRNAWALRAPADARVLVRQWGQPVVAARSVGGGELVLIGDTTWLWNRNLEGREQWFTGNIAFLSAIARGLPIATIEGRFRDPRDAVAEVADTPRFQVGSQPQAPAQSLPRPPVFAPQPAPTRPHVHPHVHPPQGTPPGSRP